MVHGLQTLDALNEEATRRRCSPAFRTPSYAASGEAVADVRFVMTGFMDEAVYIDGKVCIHEDRYGSVSIADLADYLGGRVARITNVMLGDDFDSKEWPKSYEELIPYIDTES